MSARLRSGTDIATHLLYDPVAMTEYIRGDRNLGSDDLGAEACEHHTVAFLTGSDGEMELLVCVDEEPPRTMLENAESHGRGHLDVRSGRLILSGMELAQPKKKVAAPEEFELEYPHMGTEMKVAPGVYDVEAWSLKDEYAKGRIDALIDEAVAAVRAEYPRAIYAYFARNAFRKIVRFVTIISVVALVAFFFGDRRAAYVLGTQYLWWVPLTWIALFVLDRVPHMGAMDEINGRFAEQAREELPPLIVRLSRTELAKPTKPGLAVSTA